MASRRMEPISLRTPLALLLLSLGAIAAAWWWLATPITLVRAPIDPNAKLLCVSYAPFRGAQSPVDRPTRRAAKHAAPQACAPPNRMALAFPGKEILIGETGWPSEGRMPDGALPSRTNQARIVSEMLDLAKRENIRINLIEAYDSLWKREGEGTVGGNGGLFDGGIA